MNKAIPIEDAIKFWELKEEIYRLLTLYYCTDELDEKNDRLSKEIIKKIESLGKKEKE